MMGGHQATMPAKRCSNPAHHDFAINRRATRGYNRNVMGNPPLLKGSHESMAAIPQTVERHRQSTQGDRRMALVPPRPLPSDDGDIIIEVGGVPPRVLVRPLTKIRKKRNGRGVGCAHLLFASEGGTPSHNRIEVALTTQMGVSVDKSRCEVFSSNQSVAIEEYGNYYYPDATVTCGETHFDERDNITNPVLIIEVLSRSTALYDRNTKFERYKTLSTLEYFLLVWQDTPRIEVFTRPETTGDEWKETTIEGLDAELSLPLFLKPLQLSEIYAKVTFT